MVLSFLVDKQIITRVDKEKVVRDSMNYLRAQFQFSPDWTGQKTAVFKSKSGAYNVLIDDDGSCLVPWEVLVDEVVEVSAFCGALITANVVKIITLASGYTIGEEGREPTPDVFTQIMEKLSEIEAEVDPEALQALIDAYLADKGYVTEADVETIVAAYVDAHKSEWQGSEVSVTAVQQTGTKIAEISVDGTTTNLYAPNGGGASSLSDLTDTAITNPQSGDVLVYDGSKWANYTDKVTTMPTADATNLGKIVQYMGSTNETYTKGFYYECVSDGGTPVKYEWQWLSDTPYVLTPYTKVTGESVTPLGMDAEIKTGLSASWYRSTPIAVKAGQLIRYRAYGVKGSTVMISTCEADGSNLLNKVLSDESALKWWYYQAEKDGYIMLAGSTAYISNPKLYIKDPNPIEKADFGIKNVTHNVFNSELCHIFKKVVCCGDSYTKGYMSSSYNVTAEDKEAYSWVEHMAKITGNTWINCGKTGANSKTWMIEADGYAKAVNAGKAQAYIIGLGINDSGTSSQHIDVGTTADIGTENDTFYGNMSRIVVALAGINADAFILINTCPRFQDNRTDPYNEAIRNIVDYYKATYNIHCIDLAVDYIDMYTDKEFTSNFQHDHPTALGHAKMAKMYEFALSDYMNKHIQAFQMAPWTPYDA